MIKTIYTNVNDISLEQTKIMKVITISIHKFKKPVTLKEIIIEMEKQNVKKKKTIYSLSILIKKGYIRKAQGIHRGNKSTAFVQLRTV